MSKAAEQDYYRSVVCVFWVCRPRGKGWGSRQASDCATELIRAIPVPRGAEQESRNILDGLIGFELNNPLHPDRQRDPYAFLRSTVMDWAHNVEQLGRRG